jgi:hypothetical protein
MTDIRYVITETVNGKEVEVWNTYSLQHAYALLCDYTESDKSKLLPCIYKRLPDGSLTTEY